MKPYKLLIDGKLVETKSYFGVINPATEEVIGKSPQVEEQHIKLAQKSALKGFKTWSKVPLSTRIEIILKYRDILLEHEEEIIKILISETGKDYGTATYDFEMIINCFNFFTEEAKRLEQPVLPDPNGRFLNYILRQPLGVCVGYLAWNFPLLNLGYKLGPALSAGCSIIVKPSQATPLASLYCAELSLQAGFPDGVINVITSTSYNVTNPLLTDKSTSLFTMIGSTRAGVEAMAKACTSVKHFSVELGGNAPVIVYDDANIDRAVEKIVDLKFTNSGQVCVSPNRCFVHEAIYNEFAQKAVERTQSIILGAGLTKGQSMGPLINNEEKERMLNLIRESENNGAKIAIGGKAPKGKGYYVEPTILLNVTLDMSIIQNEIFGPILPLIKFNDNDNIIELANNNEYGLSAYVFTTSLARGLQAAEQIQAGSVCINEPHYSVHLPHGGLKESGIGKDCSKYSLEEYLTLKRVSILVND